jgi:hypothetical protein
MSVRVLIATLGLLALSATAAPAQQVQIETTPPERHEREPRVVPPPLQHETSRPVDADAYRRGTAVGHDPAFIEPLAARYQTATGSGRFGLAGWTSPNQPVGSEATNYRESPGWFAIGFSITWDGPPPAPAKPATR